MGEQVGDGGIERERALLDELRDEGGRGELSDARDVEAHLVAEPVVDAEPGCAHGDLRRAELAASLRHAREVPVQACGEPFGGGHLRESCRLES